MNPHQPPPTSAVSMVASFWRNKDLIFQLTRREVIGRYKGSVIGIFWSFVNPLALLAVYTFVFSVVFKAKWGVENENRTEFAVLLFAGMIIHTLFTETLIRAPHLIISHTAYVKKIVFPLEILPIIAMGTSFFHALISIFVLIVALFAFQGAVHPTAILFPIVLLPLMIMSLGFAWFIASLGVFIRDVAQPIALLMTILLFASPVFYPASALPDYMRSWLMLNPLTFIIEQTRGVLIYGKLPDALGLAVYMGVAFVVAWGGYAWFQKTRKGFANVL